MGLQILILGYVHVSLAQLKAFPQKRVKLYKCRENERKTQWLAKMSIVNEAFKSLSLRVEESIFDERFLS